MRLEQRNTEAPVLLTLLHNFRPITKTKLQ